MADRKRGQDDRVDMSAAGALPPGGKPDPDESPWQTLGAREVYRNPWISVTEYSVRRPDGQVGIYGVVDPGDNATIVALDEAGSISLVGEFRYVTQQYHWMLPSGKVEDGEEPLTAAQRELAEEAGVEAEEWTSLGAYHLSDGILKQVSHIFLARGLRPTLARPEGTELFAMRSLPLREAVEACLRGEIADAPSVLGIWRTWFLLHDGV
ncbi:MAG TPA: NUDIX hydrolase [Ktedonobacterales bacterium]